jgi:CRP-like cAMP-binding protein
LLSFLAAFGAGALITALTIELVAPRVLALSAGGDHETMTAFWALVIGLPGGGILFVALDQLVNAHGGFLRKSAAILSHFRGRPHHHVNGLIEELSRFPLLSSLEKEHIPRLLDSLHPVQFLAGAHLYDVGNGVDCLLFLRQGQVRYCVEASVVSEGHAKEAEAGSGEVLGLFSLMTGSPAISAAVASGNVDALELRKTDFDRLRAISPGFETACRELAQKRLEALRQEEEEQEEQIRSWFVEAMRELRRHGTFPTGVQLRQVAQEHENAPLAIWLGILLDGIPESLILGSGLAVLLVERGETVASLRFLDVLPYTLIAGLFLSNLPEALYSSTNMIKQGLSRGRVLGLWTSLMLVTGIGSGLGYLLAGSLSHVWFSLFEGVAAGAMLTMIASTMIPEAVHLASANVVGLSTLAGFVVSLLFKLLE